MPVMEIPHRRRGNSAGWLIALAIFLVIVIRFGADWIIDYQWWKELGQVETWRSRLIYGIAPVVSAIIVVFAVLWTAHARGMKAAGTGLARHPVYARISTGILLLLSLIVAAANVDTWTVVRYFGSERMPSPETFWTDPVFGRELTFYLFALPFMKGLVGLLLLLSLLTVLIYWATARGWQIRQQLPRWQDGQVEFELSDLKLEGGAGARFLRVAAAIVLLALAAQYFYSRYDLLWNDHGFMVGVDYVDERIRIPLIWTLIGTCILSALLVVAGFWKALLLPVIMMLLQGVIPGAVSQFYVKPNELALQRPYIVRHIEATRSAYGLTGKLKEVQYPAKLEAKIDAVKNRPTLENVRLWDWRAFHDTVTQIQSLRQYYVFNDTDVDRYMLDGQLRQVLLTPRELDIRQLPDARANWINGHFIYTHGYGLVMAEAGRITPTGQPVLFIQDAPPKVETKSLKLTRPELYYGEITHEPVFVRTQQAEFNYPAGSENVQTKYEGKGGIPVASLAMRVAAAIAYGDRNILLTSVLTPETRMLIRRNVRERLQTLAGFLDWETDPYLVVSDEGRLVWMVDGFTSSARHPYSRAIRHEQLGVFNYVRNSVKATVDAYDGTVQLYIFDRSDPIARAMQAIFPALFKDASEMPADLRAHARYSETLLRAQSEVYRTFHMSDPESFYNREDLWDLARYVSTQQERPDPVVPTYVVATLPGESKPEYLLIQSFTPRSKDNLIGLMMARCDGDKLGEIVVLQLSKQSLIYGPLQIDARIDSDQVIAKDLSLWNQQGSKVLRGQMLVLPVDETFIYVESIYIQSQQARMPQLKKVVIAMGNTIIYRDTYEEALAELGATLPAPAQTSRTQEAVQTSAAPPPTAAPGVSPPPAQPPASSDARIETVRNHLRRYRELASQGKWAEAGKELEAIDAAVNRR